MILKKQTDWSKWPFFGHSGREVMIVSGFAGDIIYFMDTLIPELGQTRSNQNE